MANMYDSMRSKIDTPINMTSLRLIDLQYATKQEIGQLTQTANNVSVAAKKLDQLSYNIDKLANSATQILTTVNSMNTYVTGRTIVDAPIKSNGTPVYSTNDLGEMIIDLIIADASNNGNPKRKPLIFGLTGAATYTDNHNLASADNSGNIDYIHVSNEAVGCYAAAYYGDATNTVGIAMTTAGPGTAMAVPGISCAYNENKPLICFCGVPTNLFQVIDQVVMQGITKAMFFIDPTVTNVPEMLSNAFYIARNGTTNNPGPGPVVCFTRVDTWEAKYILQPQYTLYSIVEDNISSFIASIIANGLPNKKILLRVGPLLSIDKIKKLADLTNISPNYFLSLVFSAKNNLNISNYPNCAVEGQFGNPVANEKYQTADIIIEIGVGVVYTLLAYADTTIQGAIGANTKVYSVFNTVSTREPTSYTNRTIEVVDCSYFVGQFLLGISGQTYTTSWPVDPNANLYQQQTRAAYMAQTMKDPLLNTIYTPSSIVANAINVLYGSNTNTLLNDTTLYLTDVGTIDFIADSLLYHIKPGNVVSFDQYSPIGCAPAAACGQIRSGKYTDVVIVCGDGGFLNTVGYIIDLQNAVMDMGMRCLFILCNDHQYTNVSIGEMTLPYPNNSITTISSTNYIQQHINMYSLFNSLCGNTLQQSITKTNILSSDAASVAAINTFTSNWKAKTTGFSNPGMYLIYYETTQVFPYFHVWNLPTSSSPTITLKPSPFSSSYSSSSPPTFMTGPPSYPTIY